MPTLKDLTRRELLNALIAAHAEFRKMCLDWNVDSSSVEFQEARRRYQEYQEEFASRLRRQHKLLKQ